MQDTLSQKMNIKCNICGDDAKFIIYNIDAQEVIFLCYKCINKLIKNEEKRS